MNLLSAGSGTSMSTSTKGGFIPQTTGSLLGWGYVLGAIVVSDDDDVQASFACPANHRGRRDVAVVVGERQVCECRSALNLDIGRGAAGFSCR